MCWCCQPTRARFVPEHEARTFDTGIIAFWSQLIKRDATFPLFFIPLKLAGLGIGSAVHATSCSSPMARLTIGSSNTYGSHTVSSSPPLGPAVRTNTSIPKHLHKQLIESPATSLLLQQPSPHCSGQHPPRSHGQGSRKDQLKSIPTRQPCPFHPGRPQARPGYHVKKFISNLMKDADNPSLAIRYTWSVVQSVLHSAISKHQLTAADT